MTPEISARLDAVEIEVGGEGEYVMLTRGLCVAIARRMPEGLSLGSSGIMTERGLAYLVHREGRTLLASKGVEVEAPDEQAAELRKFSEDVKRALTGT